MKTRPILFGGPMVRAILEGRKTQTRRVVEPRRYNIANWDLPRGRGDVEAGYPYVENGDGDGISVVTLCPYGKAGDLLWLRETWRITHWTPDDGELKIRYEADGDTRWVQVPEEWDVDGERYNQYWLESEADFEKAGFVFEPECPECEAGRWVRPETGELLTDQILTRKRPSIYMPRWASRLTLRITNVRVERIDSITDAECRAEGIRNYVVTGPDPDGRKYQDWRTPFKGLWDSINAKRGYSWDSNPWVWVVEFERADG